PAVRLGQPHHRVRPRLRPVPRGAPDASGEGQGRIGCGGRVRAGNFPGEPRSTHRPGGGGGGEGRPADCRRRRRHQAGARLLHGADRARRRVAARRGVAAGTVRPGHVSLSRRGFRRGRAAGQLDQLWSHRRHPHGERAPGAGIHRAVSRRAGVGQRCHVRVGAAHAVWRRQEFRQRVPRAGHRVPRRLLRAEDASRAPSPSTSTAS
ncbi:MAG: hypothetical protein FD127_4484, partial [Acidimicrobiaceae bacterium]